MENMKKLIIFGTFLISLLISFKSFAQCTEASSQEIKSFFSGHSDWKEIKVTKTCQNDPCSCDWETYKTIVFSVNFDNPENSTLKIGGKARGGFKAICKSSENQVTIMTSNPIISKIPLTKKANGTISATVTGKNYHHCPVNL